jgi:hypothetical protein
MREREVTCAQVGTGTAKRESKSKEIPLERQRLRKALNTRIVKEKNQGTNVRKGKATLSDLQDTRQATVPKRRRMEGENENMDCGKY